MPSRLPNEWETRDVVAATDDGGVELAAVELREKIDPKDEKAPPGFDGYMLKWMVLDDRGTVFAPGSGTRTAKEQRDRAPVLWQHYIDQPIGRHVAADPNDPIGFKVRAAISNTAAGADAMTLLRDGVKLGQSFGLIRTADRSGKDTDKIDRSVAPEYLKTVPVNELRVITEFRWIEGSLVTFASNPKAGPTAIRSAGGSDEGEAETLAARISSLMAEIRAGTLTEQNRSDLAQLLALCQSSGITIGERAKDPAELRRDVTAEMDLLFMGLDLGALGVVTA